MRRPDRDEEMIYAVAFGNVEGGWPEWLTFARNVSAAVGLPLTHYGTSKSIDDYSKARLYSERGSRRAVSAQGIIAAEFYSVPEAFKTLGFDWNLALERATSEMSPPGEAAIGCEAGRLSGERLIALLPGLLSQIDASYGFGGSMPRKLGPMLYVNGVGTGDTPDSMDDELMRWGQDLMHTRRFEQGFFRAAFPLNLLSDLHLAQRVGDGDLAGAIEARNVPGSLRRINERITLWQIPEDGLAEAQRILVENNLLV